MPRAHNTSSTRRRHTEPRRRGVGVKITETFADQEAQRNRARNIATGQPAGASNSAR